MIRSALLALCLLFSVSALGEGKVKDIRIDGGIGPDDWIQIRKTVSEVQADPTIKKLVVGISSPGGEAFSGFGIAKLLRKLSDSGVIVEIHASGLCMSACTWIMASGTPGYRFIEKDTVVLVHPLQRFKGGEQECVGPVADAKEVDDRVRNELLRIARDLYMQFTGASKETVEEWLTCGREQVGRGSLAVKLHMADKVE